MRTSKLKRFSKQFGVMALVLTAGAANAAPFDITDGWFRALPGKLPAAGYFTAYNTTNHEIDILRVDCQACGMLMLHQSTNKGGMSSMSMLDKVAVPAGGRVVFAAGGYHLMCENPKMQVGSRVPVLFHLSDGTAVAVAFNVKSATGK
jgi:copper(I)-binding protein